MGGRGGTDPVGRPSRPQGSGRVRKNRGGIRESVPVKPVPDAFVDALRPYVSRQVWTMIELQRLTGMRPGEVCWMRTIDVNTYGRIWEYVPAKHKTEHHGKSRIIFIGPQGQAILRPWLRTELEASLFQPREAEAERRVAQRQSRKTKVQPSQWNRKKMSPRKQPRERYDTDSYRRAIAYAIKRRESGSPVSRRAPDSALASPSASPQRRDPPASGVRAGRHSGRPGP